MKPLKYFGLLMDGEVKLMSTLPYLFPTREGAIAAADIASLRRATPIPLAIIDASPEAQAMRSKEVAVIEAAISYFLGHENDHVPGSEVADMCDALLAARRALENANGSR